MTWFHSQSLPFFMSQSSLWLIFTLTVFMFLNASATAPVSWWCFLGFVVRPLFSIKFTSIFYDDHFAWCISCVVSCILKWFCLLSKYPQTPRLLFVLICSMMTTLINDIYFVAKLIVTTMIFFFQFCIEWSFFQWPFYYKEHFNSSLWVNPFQTWSAILLFAPMWCWNDGFYLLNPDFNFICYHLIYLR